MSASMTRTKTSEGGHSGPPKSGLEKPAAVGDGVQTELGRLPTDWPVGRFDTLFDVQQGRQVSKKNRIGDNQRPFLRTKNVFWNRLDLSDLDEMHFSEADESRLTLKPDDLLICEGGDIGRTAIWRGVISRCYYQNHLHRARIRASEAADAQFVLFWLWYAFEFGNLYFGRGNVTTIPNLSQSKLCELPLAIPPLAEQRKIAAVLGLVQRAIEQQERLVALTTELKKALLHKLFTEGLRGEPQKQTEIGPVPESWDVKKLGEVISEDPKNGLYKHSSAYGSGTRILRINDFSNDGDVVTSVPNRVTANAVENELYALRKDDIVTNRVNSLSHLGKTALVGELTEPMIFESNMMRFRVDEQRAIPFYILRLLNAPICKKQIIGSAKRAVAQSSINQGNLKTILLPLPPVVVQEEISAVLETVVAKGRLLEMKRQSLTDLFRTLLHQLMTAQIRVHALDLSEIPEDV